MILKFGRYKILEETIAKILAVRDQLETLIIPAKDHNTLTVYGCRQILQAVANDLTERLKAEKRAGQPVQAVPEASED